jgi:hypothetical protein
MLNDDFPNDCFEREKETMDDDDIFDNFEESESEYESNEEDVEEQNDMNLMRRMWKSKMMPMHMQLKHSLV